MVYWLNLLLIPIEANVLKKLHLNRKLQIQILLSLIFLQWFFLATFKNINVGWDTPTYEEYFYNMSNSGWLYNISVNRLEPFYILLNIIISFFTKSYTLFLGIIAIIIYGLILIRIPLYSKIPWLTCFLFVAFGFFNFSINILRQSIAISILIFSYKFIVNRSFWKFILIVNIAILFHYTAIVFIPTYFLYKLPVNVKTFLILLIGSFIISNILLPKIMTIIISSNEYYQQHLAGNNSKGYGMLGMLLASSVGALILIPKKKIDKYSHLWMIMLFLATSVQLFSLKISILVRVVYYWQISMFFIFPAIINTIFNTHIKQVVTIFIILISMLYYALYAINTGDINGTVPYSFSF